MNGLIRASLGNPHAVTVMSLTMIVLGVLSLTLIPIDILPVFKSPAVQTLTFYGGMSAESIANDITNRMERWTGQANGQKRQESRSIIGASIVRNYFQDDVDPNGALTQVNSLSLGVIPNLPPGTLPPVVLPFDPTATTPVCVVAVDSPDPKNDESVLYDVGRYEVRNYIMGIPGAVAPVVFGGKVRTVLAYLDRQKMQARNMAPLDVMKALDFSNVFLPSSDAKFGTTDFIIDSNSMYQDVKEMADIPLRYESGRTVYLGDVATPMDTSYIQTNVVRVNGKREVYIPVYRQLGASTLKVVSQLSRQLDDFAARLTRSGISLKLVMDQSVYVKASIAALVQEGLLGAILCSLVDLDVPGRDPDDGHRHHDPADLDHGVVGGPLLRRSVDQCHDAGRDDSGDRADDRQRHHLPGEHAPAPGTGCDDPRCGVPGSQRGRDARAGLDALHLPGALAAGPDARPGTVPVQADGHGRGLLDDRGVFPVADAGPGMQPRYWLKPHAAHGHGGGHDPPTAALAPRPPVMVRPRRSRSMATATGLPGGAACSTRCAGPSTAGSR